MLKTTLEVLALAKEKRGRLGWVPLLAISPSKPPELRAPFISMRIERRLGSEGPKVFVFDRASSVLGSKSLLPELGGWAGIQQTLRAAAGKRGARPKWPPRAEGATLRNAA